VNPHLTANPVTSTDSWFACPQTNPGTDIRLLLFPYAGGGPEVFGKWSAELPNDVQGCAIHYPGRGSRHNETPFNRLIPLVKALARAIQPFVDKPFAFLGHSLGSLVAFELAQHLHQNNLPQPTLLFISACGAPHLHAVHQPIHTLPDAEFIDALQKFK
jgi:medium-chain acyl-[acyl-carrier-protein] hydrolase